MSNPMSYNEVFEYLSEYHPKILPYFADGWNRFPVGNCARIILDHLQRNANWELSHGRGDLVTGAIETITERSVI